MSIKHSSIALVILAVIGYTALRLWLGGFYVYDRDVLNQEQIAKAYVLYYKEHMTSPASLAELVREGCLPTRASFYREPPGFWPWPVEYTRSTYEVFPLRQKESGAPHLLGRRTDDGKWDYNPPVNIALQNQILSLAEQKNRNP